jgi:adenosyl cobinamide kinase/adenosyl cobinamide phosphate guanylyltransferase
MIALVIGGTRSGKSAIGEQLAARLATRAGGAVTVIVPGADADNDRDLAARIAKHCARRPATWTTIECGDHLPEALVQATGIALVDSLGTWITHTLDFAVPTSRLVATLHGRRASTVLVTEEVGLAVHPPSMLGLQFADKLGELNTAVAAIADHVILAVAGRIVHLEPPGSFVDSV